MAAAFQESNVGASTVRVSVFSSSEGGRGADAGYCVIRRAIRRSTLAGTSADEDSQESIVRFLQRSFSASQYRSFPMVLSHIFTSSFSMQSNQVECGNG